MQSRTMVLMELSAERNGDPDVENGLVDTAGRESGADGESGISTGTLSGVRCELVKGALQLREPGALCRPGGMGRGVEGVCG